jgi:hypothetical protein
VTCIDSSAGQDPCSPAAPACWPQSAWRAALTQAASTTPTTATATETTPTTTTTPKSTAATRKITCKVALVATQPPIDAADNFGTLTCSAPLRSGVQHDTSTITRTSPGAGSYTGGLKLFFNTGTLRGTYRTAFTVANKTVTYAGTLKISSGTGAFQGVTGTGTITGTSTDAVHTALTDKLTLKIPATKKR